MTPSRILLAVLLLPWLAAADSISLRQGWMIRSSAGMTESGAVLSTPSYKADGWHSATLPSTVLGALVRDKVYPDPYVGMNLRQIPGTTYAIGLNFSNLALPENSPFAKSWWYRTEFRVPADYKGKTVWLAFDGINFRANVWLNGKQIATAAKMAGAWRLFEFDVTAATNTGGANALAVEVFAPTPHDLGITFVDWNPLPPDKDMGLWRDVHISATGPVEIRFPSVSTHLNSPANDVAQLTVRAELASAVAHPVEGDLKGTIGKLAFSQHLRLDAHETRVVHAAVKVENPEMWWPAQVGPQTLQKLDLDRKS